ncbi:unnamed protein product [Pleuronectes platessa]|uniref:Uncharacterized protein n=1 Tax=Pleuronectes platessa TaxID=8262 RepID=A0A9N7YUP3_PLEPL|nr:unnamed protein product [Pleuronectes platessa]
MSSTLSGAGAHRFESEPQFSIERSGSTDSSSRFQRAGGEEEEEEEEEDGWGAGRDEGREQWSGLTSEQNLWAGFRGVCPSCALDHGDTSSGEHVLSQLVDNNPGPGRASTSSHHPDPVLSLKVGSEETARPWRHEVSAT